MARDPNFLVTRVTYPVVGPKSGKFSNEFAFHWLGAAPSQPTVTDWDNLAANVIAFYNTPPATGNAIAHYMGAQCVPTTNGAEVAVYQIDLADPHHYYGTPVHVVPFTMGPTDSGPAVPNEIAAVISVRHGYGTDPEHNGTLRPRARDRGRVYIGPLANSAISMTSTPIGALLPQLNSTFVTVLKNAITKLYTTAVAAQFNPSVWSRKDQIFKAWADYAVDVQPDVQRKRGEPDPLHVWTPIPGAPNP